MPDTTDGRPRLSTDRSGETLVERIAAGEQDTISALHDRYQGLMYGMATRITGAPAGSRETARPEGTGA